MIIIFDFDGVLADAREIHFNTLNQALCSIVGPEYMISREDHLTTFDGLSTTEKLKKLGLDNTTALSVWFEKQKETRQAFYQQFGPDEELRSILVVLKQLGFKLYCASNAIEETVRIGLTRLDVIDLFDNVYGNDTVSHSKPNPEIYLTCMIDAGVGPKDSLIIEDSPVGRQGALASGAHTLFVNNRNDLSLSKILEAVSQMNDKPSKYENKNMNILVPMAGGGTRFKAMGFTFPKPLIEIDGKPMIQVVVDSLGIKANYIYIVQKEHYEKYALHYLLNLITPGCKIVQVEGFNGGAASHSLLAQEHIDNDSPLLIANSDQYINWNPDLFMHSMTSDNADGGILVFENTHPKWSYAKINEQGWVTEVAEKVPISNLATVGIYYWKHGKDYVRYANQMIASEKRVNNEFYICPVYNEAIADSKKIKTFSITEMWGLGTPEDLERFLNR